MKHRMLCRPFLCALFAALLLLAGNAPAHGIDLHAEADAAQTGETGDTAAKTSTPQGEITVDAAALEDMIVHAVGQALAQQRDGGPELRDIVGGLGWILGLLGLAAYMKHRRC